MQQLTYHDTLILYIVSYSVKAAVTNLHGTFCAVHFTDVNFNR